VTTTQTESRPTAGELIRHWRTQRRLTQQDLALEAGVSTRHLSFVETGRSRPTRAMVLRLCEHLDVPLRHRNDVLLAAGFAPAYGESPLDSPTMSVVSRAVIRILDAHRPFPALVVDRNWELVDANATVDVLLAGCSPELLEPPVNVLRLSLHPQGCAPRIRNLAEWRGHLLTRLERQLRSTGDTQLQALHDELAAMPGSTAYPEEHSLVVPLRIETELGLLSLLSTTTVFGTPMDVTVEELAIEAFFPADDETWRRMQP
jgi:transcriptional regulator with XRE-family HTH domain